MQKLCNLVYFLQYFFIDLIQVITQMTSFGSLWEGTAQVLQTIKINSETAYNAFAEDLDQVELQFLEEENKENKVIPQEKFTGLEELELLESRAYTNKGQQSPQKNKKRRIKEIEQEKRKIADQLRELDDQIEIIKGKSDNENFFKKREKIQRDQTAKKNAEHLVKELKLQRKEIEEKKRKQQEKFLQEIKKEEEGRKKIRQEELLRLKEERKQQIIQRMEQQKKKREQRKQIEAQSNHLIAKLKKQEKLEKEASVVPSQIMQVDQRKRALEKKNNFSLQEIEEHDRKYKQMKLQNQRQKEERSESIKIPRNHNAQKYGRNVWIERIEEEQNRKKDEQKRNQERKRSQLEKRLKYGELVKNIFLPKKKQSSVEHNSLKISEQREINQADNIKPTTPQQTNTNRPTLPKVKSTQNRTQNSKMYREDSMSKLRSSKNTRSKVVKQFDVEEDDEKQKIRKIRQQELRKQTNQRLKKMEEQNYKPPAPEKKKYENYLGKVKVKKQDGNQWKKIMQNKNLNEEEKYQELMKKAGDLESKAKRKQDHNITRQADEQAVNLYIGSIQAKLALLQKF